MDNIKDLRGKLEAFIRRYYLNELLKGAIFFVSIGLLYFLLTLGLEYFLWLGTVGRQILFLAFILVEALLLIKFIVIPLLKLFKLSRGLNYVQASRIIGNHFPEVKDKLLNLLQLNEDSRQSELLLAGIDQKAKELKPVPFSMAIDFRSNLPFLKYAAVPVLIILLVFLSGNSNMFADSYERVVHYKKAYAPPAPFAFEVLNEQLQTRANEPFRLQVRTVGKISPENPSVNYEGQTYFLKTISPGLFEYEFDPLRESVDFHFSGNGVTSGRHTLEVIKVPELRDFEMSLDFPAYTGLKGEKLKGSGNATVPEGTRIEWKLKTSHTNSIDFIVPDTTEQFIKKGDNFTLSRQMIDKLEYQISTSNSDVKNYENLSYSVEVVKDGFPELDLEHKIDSIENETQYFFGKVSDDYGISGVNLVYYPSENREEVVRRNIPISKADYAEFLYVFPDTLPLEKGTGYEFYFQVYDNDALHNRKSVKSRVFHYREKTDDELKEERLNQQNDAIQGLNESFEKMDFTEKELQELSRLQKQKQNLNYNDRKRLENFLERQKKQNAIMKEYSEKLKRSLEDEDQDEQPSELKEQLEERIKKKEERLEENEELLEELQKYGEKINDEELGQKLEELSKNNQNQERSLEQLLELTKKYYVEEKAAKISRDLEKLATEQEQLAEENEGNTKEAQDSLNEKFEEIREELENLEEENEKLKNPTETGADQEAGEEVKKEQEKASENLEKQQQGEAKENQKNAAEKMKKMGQKMQQQQQMAAGEQMQEDVDMLRKILDNLVVFSFEQEDLLEDFREMGRDNPEFATKLRRQNVLKEHFQHVDDSLYAMALRNPMISEEITEKLTNIEFDLDKSLERLAQNEIPQGLASQQYVVTGANDLAYFLSDILGNMQDMMSSAGGSGGGQEMQLPDIIKKQEEIKQQMQEGLEKREGREERQKQGEGGEGESEEENGELFRIFQEQQMLRQMLEEKLKKEGLEEEGKALREEMEKVEEEILKDGFNENTLRKMENLEHRLMELEDAEIEQGQKPERKSNTNTEEFENRSRNQILKVKEYFNTTEILNRQTLPLRQIYKQKVREYFERGDN